MRLAATFAVVLLGGCDVLFGLHDVGPSVDAQGQPDTPSTCFVERFDDGVIDSTLWDQLAPGNQTVAITEESGGLVARITPGQVAYNGLIGKKAFDMVDGSVEVHVTPAYMGGHVETIFSLDVSSLAQFTMSSGADNLNLRGVVNNVAMPSIIPFDAPQMMWWRFRHHSAAQTMTLETSPDGMAWTERFSVPVTYEPSAAKVQLTAGEYSAALPAPTVARWEDLRVISASCP